MSMYKDFNDIEMDLTEFEDQWLTKVERKQIKRRALKKLPQKKRRYLGSSVAAAAVLAISLVAFNQQSIANIPFVAGLLENWNQSNEVDWTPYKNTIGQTMSTGFGDLTLNEIIVDYDKVLVSATLELAEDSTFSYRHQLVPSIKINGQIVEKVSNSAQSIEQNNNMYLVYNEIQLEGPIKDELVSIQLSYDRMLTPSGEPPFGESVAEPWIFEVKAAQLAVQEQTIVKKLNQQVALPNGQSIVIDSIVTTPISTTVYFSGYTLDENSRMALVNEAGTVYHWQTQTTEDNRTGVMNFSGATFVDQPIYVELYDSNQLTGDRIFITDMQKQN
ncbi:DUF4179 domain-containing protein [Lysinibacillus sp. NPDC096418]|uniref:DUF4179 domain-containing protein n=1 Tax=Lysinibacillus sp. NPDC096418 TaxID=3364138 RepID=UPI00380AED64